MMMVHLGDITAEYIEREATIKAIVDSRNRYYNSASNQYLVGRCDGLDIAAGLLRVAPAADVTPVVHGRWDDSGRYTFPSGDTAVRCTNCGCALTKSEYRLNNWNYCPVCGAKMDGGDSDAAD